MAWKAPTEADHLVGPASQPQPARNGHSSLPPWSCSKLEKCRSSMPWSGRMVGGFMPLESAAELQNQALASEPAKNRVWGVRGSADPFLPPYIHPYRSRTCRDSLHISLLHWRPAYIPIDLAITKAVISRSSVHIFLTMSHELFELLNKKMTLRKSKNLDYHDFQG